MIFELPAPETLESESLVSCIENRRSVREYSKAPLRIDSLSQLLWSAQGITGPEQKKAIPSAGGLYPLQTHILVRRIAELEPGIYGYQSGSHSLKLLGSISPEASIREMGIGDQPWLNDAAIVIGLAGKLEVAIRRFESQAPQGERGSRYVYMESGALAQNVHLQCTALGIGCVLVAGFDDSKVKEAFGFPSDVEPTALLCIGQRWSV